MKEDSVALRLSSIVLPVEILFLSHIRYTIRYLCTTNIGFLIRRETWDGRAEMSDKTRNQSSSYSTAMDTLCSHLFTFVQRGLGCLFGEKPQRIH
jgi:hypothetical protein